MFKAYCIAHNSSMRNAQMFTNPIFFYPLFWFFGKRHSSVNKDKNKWKPKFGFHHSVYDLWLCLRKIRKIENDISCGMRCDDTKCLNIRMENCSNISSTERFRITIFRIRRANFQYQQPTDFIVHLILLFQIPIGKH